LDKVEVDLGSMGHVDVEIIGKGSRHAHRQRVQSRPQTTGCPAEEPVVRIVKIISKMSAKEKAIYHEKRNKRAEV
jgi:hypothetical protein